MTATYPFSAVLGMADMRLALLLNAVSPAIGGVLVRGEKGTAKSTAVRALAALLPPVRRVAGCRFGCDPAEPDPACPDGPHPAGAAAETHPARLVELPVGAAEDRVVGSLDLEKALGEGVRAFEPGLLAAAHRGVLYVDEVNLLHDHLVDLLLDAAAMGRSHVEREGVSVSHAARFLLVGTMNPEEGELRPQLLDRFGLTVEVNASRDPEIRVEVVRRRLAADADPVGFAARWADADAEIAAQVAAARRRLPGVRLPDAALRQIAEVCAAFDVDGMRADIVTARTALAHASWHGRDRVTIDDVRVAARLALPHRRRRDPFDTPGLDEKRLDEALQRAQDAHPDDDGPYDDGPAGPRPDGPDPDDGGRGGSAGGQGGSGGTDGSSGADGDASGHGRDGSGPHARGPNGNGLDHAGVDGRDRHRPSSSGDERATGEAEWGSGQNSRTADFGADGDRSGMDGRGGRRRRAEAGEPSGAGDDREWDGGAVAVPRGGLRARLLTAPGVGDGVPGRRSRARTGRGRTTGARLPAGR
ncbi:ATP-binding protein, partial [Micromonospora sp. NPDC005220]|uniref:ATP-binding protein n=1 Tax=Micromonospora sp. NPDC005220 TaxID=3155589 RepID=UPI0033B56CBE